MRRMIVPALLFLASRAGAQSLDELARRRYQVYNDTSSVMFPPPEVSLRQRILEDFDRLERPRLNIRDMEAERERWDGMFDGTGQAKLHAIPLVTYPLGGKQPASISTHGLRIQGIDYTSGDDPDSEARDPFLSPGLDRLFDWDVRLKVRENSLGFKADYRNPEFIRKFSVSFDKTLDVPEAFGVGPARDSLFGLINKTTDSAEKDGFRVAAAAVLDNFWGFNGAYSEAARTKGEEFSFLRMETLGVGFSPLGDNGGKPWNWSLFASGNHQDQVTESPLTARRRRSGFGYAAGTAFQHALDQVPFPLIGKGDPDGFSFDKFRAELSCSDSELADFSVRAAVQLTCRVTRHVRLFSGADCTYCPDLHSWDFGHKLGVGLHW